MLVVDSAITCGFDSKAFAELLLCDCAEIWEAGWSSFRGSAGGTTAIRAINMHGLLDFDNKGWYVRTHGILSILPTISSFQTAFS
jgi:hypothetical protein